MKMHLPLIAGVVCLGFSLVAHASDITYTITNGTFSPSGSFSGSFLINSTNELIDGGSITAIAPSGGSTYTFFNASNDSSTPGLATFTDAAGDVFRLAVDGSLSNLAINTIGNYGQSDTDLVTAAGLRFDATGGTLAAPNASAPEPSSLILLGTGVLGLAASFRRRFVNA